MVQGIRGRTEYGSRARKISSCSDGRNNESKAQARDVAFQNQAAFGDRVTQYLRGRMCEPRAMKGVCHALSRLPTESVVFNWTSAGKFDKDFHQVQVDLRVWFVKYKVRDLRECNGQDSAECILSHGNKVHNTKACTRRCTWAAAQELHIVLKNHLCDFKLCAACAIGYCKFASGGRVAPRQASWYLSTLLGDAIEHSGSLHKCFLLGCTKRDGVCTRHHYNNLCQKKIMPS